MGETVLCFISFTIQYTYLPLLHTFSEKETIIREMSHNPFVSRLTEIESEFSTIGIFYCYRD